MKKRIISLCIVITLIISMQPQITFSVNATGTEESYAGIYSEENQPYNTLTVHQINEEKVLFTAFWYRLCDISKATAIWNADMNAYVFSTVDTSGKAVGTLSFQDDEAVLNITESNLPYKDAGEYSYALVAKKFTTKELEQIRTELGVPINMDVVITQNDPVYSVAGDRYDEEIGSRYITDVEIHYSDEIIASASVDSVTGEIVFIQKKFSGIPSIIDVTDIEEALLNHWWENDIQAPLGYRFLNDGTVQEYLIDPVTDQVDTEYVSRTFTFELDDNTLRLYYDGYCTEMELIQSANGQYYFYETGFVPSHPDAPEEPMYIYPTTRPLDSGIDAADGSTTETTTTSDFWHSAYYEFISNSEGQNDRYHLFYLNDDNIPELYIKKYGSKGKIICTYSEKITYVELGTGDIKYHDSKNVLDHFSYGYKGTNLDQYYSIENGEFKIIATALNPYDYTSSEFYGKYAWDYTEVSEDEYNSKRNELFPSDGAIEILEYSSDGWCASSGGWLSYDEILDYLSTVEVVPDENTTVVDYARTEWIEQHMEYAASDEYENEIVGGYDNRMMAVFRDALDDEDIKSYETRKAISAILNLDIELSEADMYELIIAEILYGERGQYITEETYNQNLRNSVANVAKVLVNMATSGDTAKEIPADVLDSIKESYELLQTLEFGSEEYGTTYSKFISLLKGNVKDLKSKLKTELAGDAAFTGLGIVIDGAFEQYEALEDILNYINNYVAYQSTSKQTQEVLAYLAVNVLYKYDGLYGVDEFIDELGLWDSMTNWADFQTALVSVMKAMAEYEQEGAAAIAEYAVEREREAGYKFGDKALKSVTVFVVEKAASCIPVINTILLVKNVANVVVSATVILDQIFTNVDEREYALDLLTKAYCISVMLDKTVDDCVDSMSEDDFYSTTVFDESVSIYKKNLLFASGYALKYADMVLANAEEELREYDEGWSVDHLFTSRDDLVAAVTWYSNSYKLLEEQQVDIRAITCHDSNLLYDPLTDEIIYNFEDSRIYIVACPVDVIVTTDSGEQIAYLSGEENQIASGYEFYFHTIRLKDDSGEYIKVAIVPDGYRIELKGTDDGVMHAFVADFTANDVGEVETYFNIPIEKDSEGYFEASTDDTNTSSLVMDQVAYFNMESVEDIPTDSESNDAWVWIAGSIIVCGIILIVILKKKSHK